MTRIELKNQWGLHTDAHNRWYDTCAEGRMTWALKLLKACAMQRVKRCAHSKTGPRLNVKRERLSCRRHWVQYITTVNQCLSCGQVMHGGKIEKRN